MIASLKGWLEHPLTRGLSVDDPRTTNIRRDIVREKVFLRKVYEEWYAWIASVVPEGGRPALELGSGVGFLREYVPRLVTSEVFACDGVDVVLDGRALPFADASLRAVVATDVLHHIPGVRHFFAEAARAVAPGGVLALIEPWVTPWSRLVYRHLHHEPFDPEAESWEVTGAGPLSAANGALPWIIFQRDAEQFRREFPEWRVALIEPIMPLRYLVSGGVATRDVMPAWSFAWWRAAESALAPWSNSCAMFARLLLIRN